MFMWNSVSHQPLVMMPINCVLVKGFPKENDINESIQLTNVNTTTVMTQTENEQDKVNLNISKWNALFDKTFSQWISSRPKENARVYPCYACRDMFGMKQSFLDHVNRRGMLITYKCPNCPQRCPFTFYNPCTLMLHTRDHYAGAAGEIDLDNVNISVVPTGLAGFTRHPNIPVFYNGEEDNLGDTQEINTKFYAPAADSEGARVITMRPLLLLFYQLTTSKSLSHRLVLKQLSLNIPSCKFVKYNDNDCPAQSPPQIEDVSANVVSNNVTIKDEPIDVDAVDSADSNLNGIDEADSNLNGIDDVDSNLNGIDEDYVESTHRVVENLNSNLNKQKDEYYFKSARCPECSFGQKAKMIEHFRGDNKPTNESLYCPECKYIATTLCSLKAHKRLHQATPPFVCPECGKDFPLYIDLIQHLDIVCFHLAKQVRYRCTGKHCSKIFASSQAYMSHFTLHLSPVLRCKLCQAMVKVERGFKNVDVSHDCNQTCEKVYRCTVCVNNLNLYTSDNYLDHVEEHGTDTSQRVYVFICKTCMNYFRSRENYALHIVRCQKIKHGNSYTEPSNIDLELEKTTLTKVRKTYTKVRKSPVKISYIFKCRYCNNIFTSHVSYTVHLLRCSKKVSDPQVEDLKITMADLKENEKVDEQPKDTMVNCVLCNEQFSILEIRDHLSSNVCINKKNKFNTPSEINTNGIRIAKIVNGSEAEAAINPDNQTVAANIQEMKDTLKKKCSWTVFNNSLGEIFKINGSPYVSRIKPPVTIKSYNGKPIEVQIISNASKSNTDCEYADNKEMEDSGSPDRNSEIKRKRKKSVSPNKKKRIASFEDSESELEQDVPIKFNGIYYCRFCNYNSENRTVFHEHIKDHRAIPSSYQCMDCGECFIVKPSLIKHLNFMHRVTDIDTYFAENDCHDSEAIQEQEIVPPERLEEPLKENQCKVCRLEFSEEFELNKHFRVHGMAFLTKINSL